MQTLAKLEFEGTVPIGSSTIFTAIAQSAFRAEVLSLHPGCGHMFIDDIHVGRKSQLVNPVPANAFSHEDSRMGMAMITPGLEVAITVSNAQGFIDGVQFMAVIWGLYLGVAPTDEQRKQMGHPQCSSCEGTRGYCPQCPEPPHSLA